VNAAGNAVSAAQTSRRSAGLAAADCLVAMASDFSDFRGLATALRQFADSGIEADTDMDATERNRVDAAVLARSLLDHHLPHDAVLVREAAARLFTTLRADRTRGGDDTAQLAKVLVDHLSMRNDRPGIERLGALMHERIASGAVSPLWQAHWWLVMARNHEYWSNGTAAHEALLQARSVAQAQGLKTLLHECACVEMNAALYFPDLALAERLYFEIERLRPHVRAGRVPYGLRAQASLLIRKRDFRAALGRLSLLLALCDDLEVPERDRGTYHVQRAYCHMALHEHSEARAELEALRQHQSGGQADVLDALLACADAVVALDIGDANAPSACAAAMRRCAAIGFDRFLLPLPDWAGRIAQLALDAGAEVDFVRAAVRHRQLPPPDPTRGDWPWPLRIHALGSFRVEREGQALGFEGKTQKRPLALLQALVAQGATRAGRGVAVDMLMGQLWPDPDTGDPKAAFEATLSRLRKWLKVDDAVRLIDGRLHLDADRVWCDVAAFEQTSVEMLAALAPHADNTALPELAERVLALYLGPLFGSAADAAWAVAARTRLAARFAACISAHVQHLEMLQRWAEAIAVCERGLAQDVGAETLYRVLMRCHLALGQPAEAQRAFLRCQKVLAATLRVAPSAETLALAEGIARTNAPARR
jgi:DNA-binding SARP family transcriptional activator